MAGIGNVMPSLAKLGNGGHGILDLVFRDNALIMNDTQIFASSLLGGGLLSKIANAISIPLPVVGFSFENPSSLNILKYSYTEYPMLDKTMVVNSHVKETGNISVRGVRPITRGNPVVLNYFSNKALILLIEKYADLGGTWTLNTLWGAFGDLVLESLDGVTIDKEAGGVAFDFTFKRVNFSSVGSTKKRVASYVTKLMS